MTLKYGFIKGKVSGGVRIKGTRRKHETQYHLHLNFAVLGTSETWDVAANVGTNDADDLLRYRLVFDFQHPMIEQLSAANTGVNELTDNDELPALDFLRSDVLAGTGKWRDSDVMDGSDDREPFHSLARLLRNAKEKGWTAYVFGRFYTDGSSGIHDIHMNQGSTGAFVHRADDDGNDHNDVWQDGAILVDQGDQGWAAYFTSFTQQEVPTDDLGNPVGGAHEITDDDPGSEVVTPR